MKFWITKYAISRGIFEFEGKRRGDSVIAGPNFTVWCYKSDWQENHEAAVTRAEEMQQKMTS